MRSAAFLCVLGPLLGCGSDETFIIVTVDKRPAVHDATKLKVTLANAGTTRMDELPLAGHAFPVTFSISAPGRTGDLTVEIDAADANGLLVGRGSGAGTLETLTANVLLDSADFVVNTEYAEDQFMSDDFEAHGFQLAAGADGSWTAAYRGRCTVPCGMFGRRFDATGSPAETTIAAGTNGFELTTNLTTALSTPAIATAGNTTVAVWDFDDPNSAAIGVACRAIDQVGSATPAEITIATDPSTDVVSIVPLSNANFMVTWNAFITTSVIRTAIIKPDCTVLVPPATASTVASARRASVAASGSPSSIMIAWIVDGEVRGRIADNTNTYLGVTDSLFLPKTPTDRIEHVRVAPIPSGFAVAVRWASITSTGPGKIEVYRTDAMGSAMGAPVLVTDKSGADFLSKDAFGITARPDGGLLVVWHACMANGDGSGCGVFGRVLSADGSPRGEAFNLATTTTNDQSNPSAAPLPDGFAVAWKDESTSEPDRSGSSVRARIIYSD